MRTRSKVLFLTLTIIALAVRLAIVWMPGNSVVTPWSGGGDMFAYVLLAKNIVTGNGYTYAHMATAFRTPGYPLFLAGAMALFGDHAIFAARLLQAIAGLATAYFCMKTARFFFGDTSGKIALLVALFFPTLAYFSGEILTEGLTSFCLGLFFWTFVEDNQKANYKTAVAMGIAIGLGVLFRANMAVLGLVALASAWKSRPTLQAKRELLLIPLCAGLIVAPWIIRNWLVFGRPLLSTEGGAAVLRSLVNPEARLKPGWAVPMLRTLGYIVPNQLETDSPERVALGSELDIDRNCWRASRQLWGEMGTAARVRFVVGKWKAYWLGTDQWPRGEHVSRRSRELQIAAVVFYWVLLALALYGWWALRKTRPDAALIIVGYAVLLSILHTPFTMNSRIRAPLLDPLIAVLAGGALATLAASTSERTKPNITASRGAELPLVPS